MLLRIMHSKSEQARTEAEHNACTHTHVDALHNGGRQEVGAQRQAHQEACVRHVSVEAADALLAQALVTAVEHVLAGHEHGHRLRGQGDAQLAWFYCGCA